MEIRKLERNSGSTSLNIPYRYCANLGLKPGVFVAVEFTQDKRIIIKRAVQPIEETTP